MNMTPLCHARKPGSNRLLCTLRSGHDGDHRNLIFNLSWPVVCHEARAHSLAADLAAAVVRADRAEADRDKWRKIASDAEKDADEAEDELTAFKVAQEFSDKVPAILSGVTRVVVVGPHGMEYERRDLYREGVRIEVQDEGRTLKVLPLGDLNVGALAADLEALDPTFIGGPLTGQEVRNIADHLAALGWTKETR